MDIATKKFSVGDVVEGASQDHPRAGHVGNVFEDTGPAPDGFVDVAWHPCGPVERVAEADLVAVTGS